MKEVIAIPRFDFLYRDNLPHRAVAVYMYLTDRANTDGVCYPSIQTIARELKLSPSTVKRAANDLIRAGYLVKEQRYRVTGAKSSLLYRLKRP